MYISRLQPSSARPAAVLGLLLAREPNFGVQLPLRADADRAFAVLQPVYEGLGLRFNTLLTDTRVGGTRGTPAPSRIGKLAPSRYLQCGVEGMGSPNADTHAVTITAVSRVDVVGPTTSVVQTQVVASGTWRSGAGGAVRCRSDGRLERILNEAVAERVNATP